MTAILSDILEISAPTADEVLLAQETSLPLALLLAAQSQKSYPCRIRSEDGTEETIAIPESALRILNDVLTEMAKGNAVTLLPVHAELTSQQAADILDMPHTFLVEQLDHGLVPSRKVGAHRRVRLEDLLEYKQTLIEPPQGVGRVVGPGAGTRHGLLSRLHLWDRR